MKEKFLYSELTPREFCERLAAAPIAYLPLGTLEWHGEHLPLGADGIISQEFFCHLATEVGGVVLPMLFLGPDRVMEGNGVELYGMDICKASDETKHYQNQQLPGSAYWVSEETFEIIMKSILRQLRRAGFRIVVGHGHGPSTAVFRDHASTWKEKYALDCFACWSDIDKEWLGIQVDHAAMNETSLIMALRPDLVQMERLPSDLAQWPVAIGGKDPRVHASAELGRRIIKLHTERMSKILRKALVELG